MSDHVFTHAVGDDKVEKEFVVNMPNTEQYQEAQKVYNKAFYDAVQSKAILRAKLDDFMREQGLWNDDKEAEFKTLQEQILKGEQRLAKGGFKLTEARALALSMRKLRGELRDLIGTRSELDTNTAEGQADNQRFNYLVSQCLVYNDTKKPYFASFDDYTKRNNEPIAIVAAQKLAFQMYGLEDDFEKKLPENEFLQEFKFVNEDLQFINKDGHAVDQDGRLVDDKGRWIAYDENGKSYFVDKDGIRLSEDGNTYDKSERQPFLDDNDQPLTSEEVVSSVEEPEIEEAIA